MSVLKTTISEIEMPARDNREGEGVKGQIIPDVRSERHCKSSEEMRDLFAMGIRCSDKDFMN